MEQNPIKITHIIEANINGQWKCIDYVYTGNRSAFYNIKIDSKIMSAGANLILNNESHYLRAMPVMNKVIVSRGFELIPSTWSEIYGNELFEVQTQIEQLRKTANQIKDNLLAARGKEIRLERILNYPMFLISISYEDVNEISHMPSVDISNINDGTIFINSKEVPVTDTETTWIEADF